VLIPTDRIPLPERGKLGYNALAER
jgi:hypothetical protein